MRRFNGRCVAGSMQLLLSAVLLLLGISTSMASVANDLRALTGGKEMKIVWLRDESSSPRFDGWGQYRLMAYETREGRERDVLGNSARRWRPKISPDGRLIAYDTQGDLYLVDWDGNNNRLLQSGAAMGTFWYSGSNRYLFYYGGGGIVRINLDTPSDRVVCYQGHYQSDYLSVSADGSRLGYERERGNHGIMNLGNNSWTRYHNGECWSTITPDNTYRFLVFTSSHRAWQVFAAPYSVSHNLVLNDDPRFNGASVYHPRFSANDASIVSVSGPYPGGLVNGGRSAEVVVGKVNADLTQVQQWVFVTDNSVADFYPYVWVDTEGASQSLEVSTDNLQVQCTEGSACSGAGTVTVTNVSNELTVTEDASWLDIAVTGTGSSRTLLHTVDASALSAGTHVTTVLLTGGSSANYRVTATIQAATAVVAQVVLSPHQPSIEPGQSLILNAQLKDASAQPIAATAVWSLSGGGTLIPTDPQVTATEHTAMFTSDGTSGTFTVQVTAGSVAESVRVTVAEVVTGLRLTAPIAGSTVAIGQQLVITWEAYGYAYNSTLVEVSLDGGETWTLLTKGGGVSPTDTNWAAFAWTIPENLYVGTLAIPVVSSQLTLRVRGYFLQDVMDELDAPLIVSGLGTSIQSVNLSGNGARAYLSHNGVLHVDGVSGTGNRVVIYDARGAVRHATMLRADGTTPGLTRLPPGQYMVRVRDANGRLRCQAPVRSYTD